MKGLLQDFKREFPGINVVAVTGRGNELTNRIMAERRAGRFIADVYSGGTNSFYNTLYKGKALDPIKPLLILPEVTDLSKWYGNEHRYADPEGKHIFAFIGSASNAQLAYNANMVNPNEFKSYQDVTQSEVERQDRLPRPARHGIGRDHAVLVLQPGTRPGVHEEIFRWYGYHLCEELPQMTDWLAQGKFAICMGCKDSARAKNQGLPVEDFDTNIGKRDRAFPPAAAR